MINWSPPQHILHTTKQSTRKQADAMSELHCIPKQIPIRMKVENCSKAPICLHGYGWGTMLCL